ncbi:MAG: ELM1/GtrOC1 family putative glycosyltransferase [Candidatus Omnitrophota bacterium]
MKKNSIIDYWGCILFRLIGPLIRSLPLGVSLFAGRKLGELFYYFDAKHKAIAYANIKTAFSNKLSPPQINSITKDFYRSFGQNIIEMLLIPLVNKAYIDKYITIEGKQHINAGFAKGKGVIFLGMHDGSWELSNIICANLGIPFSLFIREQRYPRLNSLLNIYRKQGGCNIIQRENQIRRLIQVFKDNESIGMTADQGGKTGMLVKFFGKDASMPTGAVRLALKYDVALIPVFYTRLNGPYVKVFVEPPFEVEKTGDLEKDIRDNLQRIVNIFEKYITKYPREYLWTYKIWKYSQEKTVLILNDGKTGHLRQSQAIAQIAKDYLKERGITTNVHTLEIEFKNKFSRYAFVLNSYLAGKYRCQGCLDCLKMFLREVNYKSLVSIKPDIVISCGSSVAAVNYAVAKENLAKSIVIMRPAILSTGRFDLVVMSQHDRPARRKNIAVIEGALNSINEVYLQEQAENLKAEQLKISEELVLGLLIGGDTKTFRLTADFVKGIIAQIKNTLKKLDAQILITTSRRTSRGIEQLLKQEFVGHLACKLLVIANEKNIPAAVGGILALSKIVITSPESISMVSEAVNSKKYVLVFNAPGLGSRHKAFLKHFAQNKYINLVDVANLGNKIEETWVNKPLVHAPQDNILVSEAIKNIL